LFVYPTPNKALYLKEILVLKNIKLIKLNKTKDLLMPNLKIFE